MQKQPNNPYLDVFKSVSNTRDAYDTRRNLVKTYAWAVPTDEAIACLVKYGSLVEVGAGTGYWASLIVQAGGKIDAYDIAPPEVQDDNYYGHERLYWPVLPISCLKWDKTQRKTLFLCWPPYRSSMASDALKQFRGSVVAYIGEGSYGCTADEAFHDTLDKQWNLLETVRIPQWFGINDNLTVWGRR